MSNPRRVSKEVSSDLQDCFEGAENIDSAQSCSAPDSPVQNGAKTTVKATRPRSNTCPALHSPTHSKKLKLGSQIVILGTGNVEQRVPHLVGVEATIVDVPVHPATWYKVQFEDGSVVTFRPSALRLASDCVNMESADFHIALNKPKYADGEVRAQRPKSVNRPRSNSSTSAPDGTNLLSTIDPDSWPTCRVRILGGRLAGLEATVRCSGNGWVQLDTLYGEVAKRANELELLEVGPGSISARSVGEGGLTVTLPRSHTPSYARSRSHSESLLTSPRTSMNTFYNSSAALDGATNGGGVDNGSRIKLVDAKTRALQQEYMEQFIQKQKQKYQNRPDLKYWARQIRGGMVDTLFERDMSRDLRDQYCHSCHLEKLPSAKFCWNELCPSSPVYWQLPGSAGDPQAPKRRYEDMQTLLTSQRGSQSPSASTSARVLTAATCIGSRVTVNLVLPTSVQSGCTESSDDEMDYCAPEDSSDCPPTKKERVESTTTQNSVHTADEQLACSVLGNLYQGLTPRYKHTDALANLVTEFIHGVPSIQLGAQRRNQNTSTNTQKADLESNQWASPPPRKEYKSVSLRPPGSSLAAPNSSLKDKRSDSSHTDTEDVLVEGSSADRRSSKAVLPTATALLKAGYVRPVAQSKDPSSSPPGKKPRNGSSTFFSPGRQFVMHGAPPSQEEFERLVSQPHFAVASGRVPSLGTATDSEHTGCSTKDVGGKVNSPLTIPLSVLAARVAASKCDGHGQTPVSPVGGVLSSIPE